MKKYLLLALCVRLSFGLVFGQPKPQVLFTIDKSPTTTNEFLYLFKKNHTNKQDFTETKVNEYLDLFVNFKLKIREAHQRGYDTTAKFIKELKTYGDELKKPYRAEKDLLDKLTKETYEHLTQEIKASHILVEIKANATPEDTIKAFAKISEIRKRVLSGEDFEKVAAEVSEDPSAKSNGGSLGYFTAMQMVYPFEEAAYEANVGEISPIVRTRFGYHVIKVMDKRSSRGEVEVSHILLRMTKPDEAKAKNQIFEIYDQLKSGRSWEELCKEFSEDTNTKNTGGKLRPFGVGALPAVPEFEAAAFALDKPGDVSDPFRSNIGWHIIRLEKKIPMPAFPQIEASLKKRVARDERLKISEQAASSKRRTDLGFKEDAVVRGKLLSLADSNLLKNKWKFGGTDETRKGVLFEAGGKTFAIGDFVIWLGKKKTSSTQSPKDYMNQLYNQFVNEKIDIAEEEKIVKENPDFSYLLSEYREGILLFEIMEKEIWNKASDDTVGQKKFYTEHLDKYKAGPRVEARIFSATDKAILDDTKKKIAQADTLTSADLKKFKSVQHFRNYERGESKVIDKINWVPGVQETELDGVYYLVEVVRLVEAGIKKFSDARAQVISGYQDTLEKNWVESLRKKYPVKVNTKNKNAIVQELIKK